MAYINVLFTTESAICVQMAGLQISYELSNRVCTWYLDGERKGTSNLGAKVSSDGAFTFSGLRPRTSYEVAVSIIAPGWASPVELNTVATTDSPPVEPWSWTDSNGSASASQTRAAYSAISNHGAVSNFSYLVWNDLVEKVMEVLNAFGGSWNNTYASYSATKMTTFDKELTASRFNSLRYNIGTHYATGINDVHQGDIVYGSYFITLANSLNSWIG